MAITDTDRPVFFVIPLPGRVQSLVMSYEYMSVCLLAHISRKLCDRTSPNFLFMLTVTVPQWSWLDQSSFDGVAI